MDADKVKEGLLKTNPLSLEVIPNNLLSTGSTVVNLACSGHARGGLLAGSYVRFMGDSSTGKTWFALSCLAEAARSKRFAQHRLVYDNVEEGALMSIGKFFGEALLNRLEAPATGMDGKPKFSYTIDDFYFNAMDRFEAGPCIYVLDSLDALDSEEAGKKFEERRVAHRKGKLKDVSGTFTDGKAKKNSQNIRKLVNPIREHGSILVLISQTRDNIGGGMFEPASVVAGGRSITFYQCFEMWTKRVGSIKKKVKGKDYQIGINCRVQIKKNRLTGREWAVDMPIYHEFGIDDLGSCIDFLVEQDHWKESTNGAITADELEFKGSKNKIIAKVEDEGSIRLVRGIVAEVWKELEAALNTGRKSQYE